MRTKTILITSMLFSALIASTVAQAETKLNAADNRITDKAIKADQATYTETQARIAALNKQGIPVADYSLAKAQCWLDVSLHEYTRNDRSNFPEEALNQADLILSSLEQKTSPNPSAQTPLVNNADKLRDDLWATLNGLKQAKGITCYAQKVACAEVELVHAGNENKQQGWRHANPYIQIAEGLTAQSVATGDSCLPPPVIAPTPVAATALPVAEFEEIIISADALFKFDKFKIDDCLPTGKAMLDELAAKLQHGYVQIDSIKLTGYTDRLASDHYNLALSEKRSNTVRAYLQAKGVSNLIQAYGKGAADQVVACGTSTHATKALIDCLLENRRVVVEIKGIKRK